MAHLLVDRLRFWLNPNPMSTSRFVTLLLILLGVVADLPSVRAAGRQLTGDHAPASSPALTPEEARKKFTVPPGFEVRLFAAEPDVVNPVAMTWDERGRLWVVELYEYPLGAPAGVKPRDRIKILEDTDGDGRADKVTVFADGLNLATGLALGYGGVFVGQAPQLLFLEDTNGDGVADRRTVLKEGFGLHDRHELLNGFVWGPDGWLYMTHGVFTFSKVHDPGSPESTGVTMNAAVARYHPRTHRFEVFADGTSNPWGVDFDREGNAFVSACVIDHLFHMAPGGLYARQAGSPENAFAYEVLPSIVEHKHYRAAYCGIQVYQGNQYPKEWQGEVLMGNIHQNAVNHDHLTRRGATFHAESREEFLSANDGWFRPVSEQVGPDGAVWVLDWYDKYPCYQNANADPEGVDRERGRVWRVVYTGDKPGTPVPSRPAALEMGKASATDLTGMLSHPNVWQRRTAQRLLTERAGGAEIDRGLESLVRAQQGTVEGRLAALWTLHGRGALTPSILDFCAGDKAPEMRLWAARLTGEGEGEGEGASRDEVARARLQKLAEDPEDSVRLAVAVALRQWNSGSLTVDTPPGVPSAGVLPIFQTLIAASAEFHDATLPFLIWMAMEPRVPDEYPRLLEWFAKEGGRFQPLTTRLVAKLMRRLVDMQQSPALDAALAFAASVPAKETVYLSAILDALIEGQKGKSVAPTDASQAALRALLGNSSSEVAGRAQRLAAAWGDAEALRRLLGRLEDPSAPVEEKMQILRTARQMKNPTARAAILRLLDTAMTEALAIEAVRALGQIGGDDLDDQFIGRWPKFSPATRREAVEALNTRMRWRVAILSAVEQGRISPADVPQSVVRGFASMDLEEARVRAAKALGRFRPADADKLKLIAEKKHIVLNGPVDLDVGHEVAKKTCLVCHRLHGEGADVGPDLSGVGRSSLDALLANVIDPNQVIGKGYENVEVETKDGRTLSGRMVENSDSRVRLLSSGPKEEIIAKSDVSAVRVSELSVMPEGLEQMASADFRNLIWYVLNPPEDPRRIRLDRTDRGLVVRSTVPGATGMVELVSAVLDVAGRPYLHPVMDPSGEVVVTEDRPADHVWQHGIFTGLHAVAGMDFWTEKQGQIHFEELADIEQELDYVGWTARAAWRDGAGKDVLREEQQIRVYRPESTNVYLIDFTWRLQAVEGPVTVGRHDYGGFSARPVFSAERTHLNSEGKQGADTANVRASWCSTAHVFPNGGPFGLAIMDHPSNPGYPSFWRVDGQGFINPSPSLAGDWSIPAAAPVVRHYRVAVFRGLGDAAQLSALAAEFGRVQYASEAAGAPDGESAALWNPLWKVESSAREGTPRKLPEYAGRKNALQTHPLSRTEPARLSRKAAVPAGPGAKLSFWVAADERGDWELRVLADGKLLKTLTVNREGDRWKKMELDLSAMAGRSVDLVLENRANDWSYEFGYWSDIVGPGATP